jgi:hypothetical protein
VLRPAELGAGISCGHGLQTYQECLSGTERSTDQCELTRRDLERHVPHVEHVDRLGRVRSIFRYRPSERGPAKGDLVTATGLGGDFHLGLIKVSGDAIEGDLGF